jgi:hypothetical protein
MGYQTYSYQLKEHQACLVRNMFGWETMEHLFNALGISNKFTRINGDAQEIFSVEQIKVAIDILKQTEVKEDVLEFLIQTIDGLEEYNYVALIFM